MLEYDYPDLKQFVTGGSWARLFQTLYFARLLRYSTKEHLQVLTGSLQVATKPKLTKLANLGYLTRNGDVFTSTSKTLELLIKQGYNPHLLPSVAEGRGAEIYTQNTLCKLIKHVNFKALLYPHFEYVIPDALVILEDGNRYQLNFIEVEEKKPKWSEYLEEKREKYNRLAKDEIVYKYWQQMSGHLGMKCPAISGFRFRVWCFSEITFDWRGWKFNE